MRLLMIGLFLPAFVQEPNDAEKLFRKMEKQFISASTLQFQFETLLEGGLEKGAKVRGTFMAAYANLMRVTIDGDFDGKAVKGELVSDGKLLKAVLSSAEKPREHEAPPNLNAIVKTMTGRTGVFFGLEALEQVIAPVKGKPLPPEKAFAVSDFKMGEKEKVDGKNADVVHYSMTFVGTALVAHVTVWIDPQTDLPLKRVITDKKGKKGFTVTETYSGFTLNAKLDAKMFELPK